MAIMWIVTGVVSIWVYPVQDSFALLARTGVPPILQPLALYGAGALDILLGVLCFVPYRRRLVWLVQIALIVFYTVMITLRLPEFWLHPYGPILKNLPILAALGLLCLAEPRSAGRGPSGKGRQEGEHPDPGRPRTTSQETR